MQRYGGNYLGQHGTTWMAEFDRRHISNAAALGDAAKQRSGAADAAEQHAAEQRCSDAAMQRGSEMNQQLLKMMIDGEEVLLVAVRGWRGWGFCGCGRGTRPAWRAERFLGGERGRR